MILVTGASGFVGSNLTKTFAKKKIPFRTLSRSLPSQEKLEELGYETSFGDVTEDLSIEQAFDEIDTVVHLASSLRATREHSLDEINRIGTRNVVRAAEKAGVKRIIYMSSISIKDDDNNLYDLSKLGAEQEIKSSKKLKHLILRSAMIYGKDGPFINKMSGMIGKSPFVPIIGDGNSKVQPLHINNVVDTICRALESDHVKNETHEIGGPDSLNFNEICKTFAIVMRKKRRFIHFPIWLVKPFLYVLDKLIPAYTPISIVEMELLQENQEVKSSDFFKALEITPIPFKEGLREIIHNPPKAHTDTLITDKI